MKILNEHLRKNIVKEAIKEFKEHGFEKSSLRKIVKHSGTTIGNFYNYYKSKEDLFNFIIEPFYEFFMYFLKNHHEDERFQVELPLPIDDLRKLVKLSIKQFIEESDHFIILFTGSKGTKFENAKEYIIEVLSENLLEHLKDYNIYKKINIDNTLTRSLANGFIEGIMYILRRDESKEKKLEYVTNFILLFFQGILNSSEIIEE